MKRKGRQRKIVAVHPEDAFRSDRHRLINRTGRFVGRRMIWDYGKVKGYEYGDFILDGKPLDPKVSMLYFYAISTLPA